MRHHASPLAAVLFLLAGIAYAVAPIGDELIVPERPLIDLSAELEQDPFATLPLFPIGHARQMVDVRTWEGENDYSGDVGMLWNPEQLCFRFRIVDDMVVGGEGGDSITIVFNAASATPLRSDALPLSVVLTPDAELGMATVTLPGVSDQQAKALGKIETRFKPFAGGYELLVVMPTAGWANKPNSSRHAMVQAIFQDRDAAPVDGVPALAHVAVLHPSLKDGGAKLETAAKLNFVSDRWLSVRPLNSLYRVGDAQFLVDYGNTGDFDLKLRIRLLDYKTGELVKEFPDAMDMPKGSMARNVPLQIDLSDLPTGAYRVKSTMGEATDDKVERYIGVSDEGVLYDPLTIERRASSSKRLEPHRRLGLSLPEDIKYSLQVMAGNGQVQWYAGKYDAASFEFSEALRPVGPRQLTLPLQEGREGDIPWALFARNEELGGMNRPLIIKFDESIFYNPDDLRPETPAWPQYESDPVLRKLDRESKRLMLLGLVTTYAGPGFSPWIRVTTEDQVLFDQRLDPGPYAQLGGRYAYVLRLWITSKFEDLRIENVSDFGHHAEIDFMAVLQPGELELPQRGQPNLIFQGHQSASMFTKQLNTSSYMMRTFMVDRGGVAYPSLPGGLHKGDSALATAMLLNELSAWNAREARTIGRDYLRLANELRGPAVGYSITKPLAILGIYNLWRRSGRSSNVVDPLWGVIRAPIDEIERDLQTHPLGLVNIRGRYGVGPNEPGGATYPAVMATLGALRGVAEIAEAKGERELADRWSRLASDLEASWRDELMTSATTLRVDSNDTFPASDRLPEFHGISSQIPSYSLIYGRYDTSSPIVYANGRRVFDTPQVFSGLAFGADVLGIVGDEQIYNSARSAADMVFGKESPLIQDQMFQSHGIIDYVSTENQAWAIRGALMADREKLAAGLFNAFVRYNYDEMLLADGAAIEVSPWTFEDKFNVGENGYNLGPVGDDLNIFNGVAAMSLGRFIVGVDDSQFTQLRFATRLPAGWTRAAAQNWRVSHNCLGSSIANIDYSYEAFPDFRYSVSMKSDARISNAQVQIGPFLPRHIKVKVTTNEGTSVMDTVKIGLRRYLIMDFEDTSRFNISAQVHR